jgi:uncharacterized protein YyaL (SSP411 family)
MANSPAPPKYTNALIHESSPYLLQHAHNPVNWQTWNEKARDQARREHKLILVSIGYSACHWCHVMEHESFESESVAQIMNEHFVCIKIDREERPDIDQLYMSAVQLMTGHGGWPLNCFTTPDGRPVYGGTYFQKDQWKNILQNLTDLWKNDTDKVYQYAEQLSAGIQQSELLAKPQSEHTLTTEVLLKSWKLWSTRIDTIEGGPNRAPKFPLPNNYSFLLRYAETGPAEESLQNLNEHVHLTLRKMAYGGIYDQLGGGFARYSTDNLWKAPHFEKMLYDNAQLVSLYAEAWQLHKDPLYKQIVYETLNFISRELIAPEGAFYSALDADTEGEEGKFYTWTEEELTMLLGNDFPLFAAYYNINEDGLWEHGNYILLRKKEDTLIASEFSLSMDQLHSKLAAMKKKLLLERNKRPLPGLDDKSLCSWNALMAKGYTDAYRGFGEPSFLNCARRSVKCLLMQFRKTDGGLFHCYKQGKGYINGFLEDYSFTIEACLALYEITFDTVLLEEASALCEYACKHFQDEKSRMFYFTSDQDEVLIARKYELSDNVIPASNSSMAKALFLLGHQLEKEEYVNDAKTMLLSMQKEIEQYGSGYSNWAQLQLWICRPFSELVIVGKDVDEKSKALHQHYLPNLIFAGSKTDSDLPLLKNRYKEGATLIYVCRGKTCLNPVTDVSEALKLLQDEL